ncbi:YxeA family protein [Enterococcus gallinarum]|uniref:YxeA family protein n=1 Tax=Enterococcus gallinarum TaxID=1353 RepID=UPI003D6ACDE6
MKKIIASLIVFGVFLGGCFFAYRYYYGGTAYYTEITTSGTHSTSIASDGVAQDIYKYEQAAYNESGEEKIVKMNEHRSKPLREGAYLKLLVNPRKGVLSWEEVSQDDVPKPALDQLNNK